MQPVNYSGTQVNIFGSPPPEYVNQMMQQWRSAPGPAAGCDPASSSYYPYSLLYPPGGFSNQIQFGFMTEHMLRKLDESRLLTMNELLRNSQQDRFQATTQPQRMDFASPSQAKSKGQISALEYDIRSSSVSPGNGDWRGQLKHIYAQLVNIAMEDKNFRISIGEPRFAEIVSADLEVDDDAYSLTLKFAKDGDNERGKGEESTGIERRPKTPASIDRKFGRSFRDGSQGRTVDSAHGVEARKPGSAKSPAGAVGKKPMARQETRYEKENIQQEGTLKLSKQFNAESDANALRKAMKGVGTDEDAITNTLGKRPSTQRQEIIKTYKTLFGKDLVKDLKSELSGDYWRVVQALCQTPPDYDASELNKAVKGLGTDDDALIEIICTRNNKSLKSIQESYKRLFNRSLEDDVLGDTSSHYGRLLVALLQANRDESNVIDLDMAKKEAQELYDAGAGKWGTDESAFNAILVKRSYSQLKATFKEYEALAGMTMEDAIQGELSDNLAKGMLAIVQCVKGKPTYFAQKLYNTMKGLGTDDDAVIRIIVSRCEVDMVQIKEEFQRQFKQSLAQFIADDTSGDYRKILLMLLGETSAIKT